MIGKIYPSEKMEFKDSETGAEIVQYTQEGTVNRTLYFTNRPYTSDGEHVVFLSNRSGRNEMYLLHLKSGKIIQLTELEGQSNVANCVHPTKPELYFRDACTIYRVNWDTLQTEALMEAPEGWNIGILNLNSPPWLVFEMNEKGQHFARVPGTDTPMAKVEGGGNERCYMRDRTLLYRLNIESGELDCLWGDSKYLSHVQTSPTNSDLVIFSNWNGYGDDRCYYLDLERRIKGTPQPMFPETSQSRGTHECFTRRGNLYIQWVEGDLEPGRPHTMYHAFRQLAGLSNEEIAAAPLVKYELPRQPGQALDYCVHHFTMSEDETWGVHDRWMSAPTYEDSMSWLTLFRHQLQAPRTRDMKLSFHNGSEGDALGLGANLTIDHEDEYATYTSFLQGNANLCQVRLTPFVDQLMS